MNNDIKSHVAKCGTCKTFAYRQPAEPLKRRDTPTHPRESVVADLFQFSGASYVDVFDAYSHFLEVVKLGDTSSCTVIDHLSNIFSRHGVPQQVCTDNGP